MVRRIYYSDGEEVQGQLVRFCDVLWFGCRDLLSRRVSPYGETTDDRSFVYVYRIRSGNRG